MHVLPHESVAAAVALVASVCDLRTRRIPNLLTCGAAAAAFLAAAWSGGGVAVSSSGAGWLLALGLWLPFYALGGMGAGDVKLMAAIGAWLGPGAVLHAALYAAIAGGVMALGIVLVHRCLRQTLDNISLLMLHWRTAGLTPHAQLTLESAASPRLAYAVPILIGTLAAIWIR